ncbi:AAA family ATPase [Cronobacter sp. EKM101R]|uniref:AAA family ATPase n=2 Tax=Enterobacteriaceae TaxID=543 RepID=UPI001627688F|nr:AAA family ATPase [Cronobacter sp. EKM101R]KAF6594752.1 AAA family ATPase [Cronobacter sp. EKM101R]HDI3022757.1 AAA family ATPase [Cronobacter turicensis]
MALFQRATNTQAFLKAGIMGFAGDGKTYTASELAIGLVLLMRQRGLPAGDLPVMFLDTETGSDWVKPRFDAENIELYTAKTRAFVDLLAAVNEAEQSGSALIIDSVSHFWTVLCDEYATRRNRKRGLEFSDWAWLKQEWRRFTDRFVNSQAHIIMCGRAGYEYDFFEGDDGKRQLAKTGIKMKAETETGYEPSILIQMEKQMDLESGQVWRTARILKDRSTRIDGQTFSNPTFKHFQPHIEFLNLGGTHLGVDTSRDNGELFADDGQPTWQKEKRAKEIALDEIVELLNKHHGGTSNDAKRAKADILEEVFCSRSWERIKGMDWPTIKAGRDAMWLKLENTPYQFPEPSRKAQEAAAPEFDEDIPQ